MFDALKGARIPGGCDDCDAYQVITDDPTCPGVTVIQIRHDETCPYYRARLNRAQRRARRRK